MPISNEAKARLLESWEEEDLDLSEEYEKVIDLRMETDHLTRVIQKIETLRNLDEAASSD